MSERQSSGLVKKGKFVRNLMDLMNDGVARSIFVLLNDGGETIGPNVAYVQTNLDKLVASGEVILENENYRLPNAIPAQPKSKEPAEGLVIDIPQEPVTRPTIAAPKQIVMLDANNLVRNEAFEMFLSGAFLNEIPGWEKAIDYYCATHNAKWSIVSFKGKASGDRIIFE